MATKQKFEEKYWQQRSVKEVTRENSKLKKNVKNNQGKDNSDEVSIKDFMEEFRNRFDSQDKKLDKNHRKMVMMNLKLERLEAQSKKYKKDN